MKPFLIFTFLFISSNQISAQDGHFCAQDSITQKGVTYLNEKAFVNLQKTGGKNYWKFGQYNFSIKSDSLKEAYQTILEYDFTETENAKYVKLGKFKAHELRAPSNTKDALKKGAMLETWAFYKHIEVWYNGEKIYFLFPELINKDFTSNSKMIFVPKACIKACLNTFKYK